MFYTDVKNKKSFCMHITHKQVRNVVVAYLKDLYYTEENKIDDENQYLKWLENVDFLVIIIDNENQSFKFSSFDVYPKFESVNVYNFLTELYESDTKVKYMSVLELNKLFDGSMSATDQLFIEELVNDYGFTPKDSYKKYLAVDFVNKNLYTFENVNETYTPNIKISTISETRDYLEDYLVDPIFIRHEAIHTTHLMTDNLYSNIVDHHYYYQEINPKFNHHIDLALDHLHKAYNAVGDHKDNEVKKYLKNIHRG